ncbi:thioredoxin, putative [Entamoeba invadens IP1]|uniref:Thioredoxin n=1 Tax=Entamoeba invadens IP1 TaxID=370355 RepID=A0A0A1UH85_ENTIV|nr:thioredoxin, putative [Entamoeba invadens IP1]ELP94882.1 thioredoxin, putative [Entamoeba invadens IP1]|eukprot:XP_004261653.1 thioredoxin, putative [Entamoeba invadens IP1]
MPVTEITSVTQFNEMIATGDCIVDFYATWCGPCRSISPYVEELSRQYPTIKFCRVDTSQVQTVAAFYQIRCIPTFYFFSNGIKMSQFSGADRQKLNDMAMWAYYQ